MRIKKGRVKAYRFYILHRHKVRSKNPLLRLLGREQFETIKVKGRSPLQAVSRIPRRYRGATFPNAMLGWAGILTTAGEARDSARLLIRIGKGERKLARGEQKLAKRLFKS